LNSPISISKEDSVKPGRDQLDSQLFEAECFAYEDSVLLPADVAAIVDSSQEEALRVRELSQLARQWDRAGDVDTCGNWIGQALVPALVIEYVAKAIESALLCEGIPQAVLSCPPSVCDASARGDRFVAVGPPECAHARSRGAGVKP